MKNFDGALGFEAQIATGDFNTTIKSMNRQIEGLSNKALSETERMGLGFKNLSTVAAGALAGMGLAMLPAQIVKIRGEFQQLEIALNTMLGSKAKADQLMSEIIQTAATTPFGMKDLAAGTKQLIAYGSAAETVMGEVRMLGDVASGVSQPIGDLIYLYGTLRTQGRAYAVDIRQFAGRGIPIYAELAKVLQVNVSEVNALVEAGKVGFKEVEQAFRNMTSAGGMFNNLMADQSKSLPGLIERLKDGIDVMFNEIGKSNQGLAEDVIKGAATAVENYQQIIDVLTVLAATYGTYKTAVITASAIDRAAKSSGIIAEAEQLAKLLTVEQQAKLSKAGLTAGTLQYAEAVKLETATVIESNTAKLAAFQTELRQIAEKRVALKSELEAAAAKTVALRAEQAALIQSAGAEVSASNAKKIASLQKKIDTAATRENTIAQSYNNAVKELGSKRAQAMALANTAETLSKGASTAAEVRLTAAQTLRATLTRQLISLQAALNSTMLANPIVAVAAGVAGLVGLYFAFRRETLDLISSQELLSKANEGVNVRVKQEQAEVTTLLGILKNKNIADSQRLEAYNKLNSVAPDILKNLDFEAAKITDLTKATQDYISALERRIKLEANQEGMKNAIEQAAKAEELAKEARDRYLKAQKGPRVISGPDAYGNAMNNSAVLEAEMNAAARDAIKAQGIVDSFRKQAEQIFTGGTKEALENQIKTLEQIQAGLKGDKLGAAYKKTEDEIAALRKQLETQGGDTAKPKKSFSEILADTEETGALIALKTIAKTENQIKALSDRIEERKADLDKGSAEYKKLQAAYEQLNPKKSSKKADEVFLPTSLKGLEQAAQKARDIMERLPGTDQAGIKKQQEIIIQAEKRIAEIRKSIAVKSFEEEITEKQKQYELYERWVQHMGEDAAKAQFRGLLANGASYADFLNAEIEKLTNKGLSSGYSDEDLKQLDSLKSLFNDFTGAISPMEKFQKTLDDARESAGSLTEEIIRLKEIQAGLNPADNSSSGYEKRSLVQQRLNEAEKERRYLLGDFLRSVAGSEERRLAIEKQYADIRNDLDARTADKKSDAYLKALKRINDAEKKELEEDSTESVLTSKAYKELEQVLNLTKRNDTGKRLEVLKSQLSQLVEGTDEYIQKLKEVKDAELDHKKYALEGWANIANIVGELGVALEGYGGKLGELGGGLSGLASAAAKVSTTFANMDNFKTSDGKMSMDGYVAAAQNLISIITGIIGANQKRIEAERQFAAERLGFENDYALQLNQGLGSNYKTNPFYQDYEGMIKAGVDQYDDAFIKYQAAIDKLEEGKVKERQKNVVDGKTTLGMVGAGAAAGAIIGSAIPGIGNAVGAIVGGVVGLVGGLFSKKKKDVYGSLMEQYPELVTETAEGWAELNLEMAKALITNNQVDDSTRSMLENAIALNEEMQKAKEQIQDTVVELTGQIGDNLRNALVEAFREGNSEAQALHKTISSIIADVTSKLLFSKLIGPSLDKLVNEMTQSLTAGDGTIVDDLVRFDKYGLPAVESYFDGLSQLEEWAKSNGFNDIFGRSQGNQQALQGSIKGMSEETASVLVGQFNAVRIYQADMASNTRISVGHLQTIANNTSFNRYLVRLENIENHLSEMKKSGLRSGGL